MKTLPNRRIYENFVRDKKSPVTFYLSPSPVCVHLYFFVRLFGLFHRRCVTRCEVVKVNRGLLQPWHAPPADLHREQELFSTFHILSLCPPVSHLTTVCVWMWLGAIWFQSFPGKHQLVRWVLQMNGLNELKTSAFCWGRKEKSHNQSAIPRDRTMRVWVQQIIHETRRHPGSEGSQQKLSLRSDKPFRQGSHTR